MGISCSLAVCDPLRGRGCRSDSRYAEFGHNPISGATTEANLQRLGLTSTPTCPAGRALFREPVSVAVNCGMKVFA